MSQSSTITKNNSISFFRIVFTLLIVLLHCTYTQGGYIGVEFFFLVSGVLLAKSIYEKDISIKEFFVHRLKRLYPMYLFANLFYLVVYAMLNSYHLGLGIKGFPAEFIEKIGLDWRSFFMLQFFGPVRPDSYFILWYVVVLFWLSLLFFIISKIMPKNVFTIFVGITVAAVLIYIFISTGNLDLWKESRFFVSEGFFRGYLDIGIGILLYNVKKLADRKIELGHPLFRVIEIIGYASIIIVAWNLRRTKWDFLLLLIMAICVTISFSEHKKGILNNKAVNVMSKFSYAVYLLHPIFLIASEYYSVPFELPPRFFRFVYDITVTVVCAVLSELLIGLLMQKIENHHSRKKHRKDMATSNRL